MKKITSQNNEMSPTPGFDYMALLTDEPTKPDRAFLPVFQGLDLSPLDWMTIRDLLEIGDIRGDLPLLFVLALMFAAMREGSLCLELNDTHVSRLLGQTKNEIGNKKVTQLIDQFLNRLADKRYHQIVATKNSIHCPLVYEPATGTKRLYFQRFYVHEKRLHHQIKAFLSGEYHEDFDSESIETILNELYCEDHSLRLGKSGSPIVCDAEQVAAIRQALSSPFTIISGGPGTGKTSVMVNLLRGLVRNGVRVNRIALTAPTGRAAQRMTEALSRLLPTVKSPLEGDLELMSLKGSTLHKRLRYNRYRHDFYYRKGNPIPVDVVIIDEVSMVDVVMLAKFLESLDPVHTRLILMGDKDQLPSVEAGAVFAEMIPTDERPGIFKDHLVMLRNNYRTGNEINRLANTLNLGRYPDYQPVDFNTALGQNPDHWAVVSPMGPDSWQACLQRWADHYFLSPGAPLEAPPEALGNKPYPDLLKSVTSINWQDLIGTHSGRILIDRIFKQMGRAKILTLLRHGQSGCLQVNSVINTYLAARLDTATDMTTGLFSGAVIMVIRNDYEKELFNGDIGVVIRSVDGGFRAYFQRSDTYHVFAVSQLPEWEPAFAVTVHKSQGSEFDDVMLVLPEDSDNRLLTREILYTAITRARKRVLIYGSRQSIQTAVSRKIARQSGLVWEDRNAG